MTDIDLDLLKRLGILPGMAMPQGVTGGELQTPPPQPATGDTVEAGNPIKQPSNATGNRDQPPTEPRTITIPDQGTAQLGATPTPQDVTTRAASMQQTQADARQHGGSFGGLDIAGGYDAAIAESDRRGEVAAAEGVKQKQAQTQRDQVLKYLSMTNPQAYLQASSPWAQMGFTKGPPTPDQLALTTGLAGGPQGMLDALNKQQATRAGGVTGAQEAAKQPGKEALVQERGQVQATNQQSLLKARQDIVPKMGDAELNFYADKMNAGVPMEALGIAGTGPKLAIMTRAADRALAGGQDPTDVAARQQTYKSLQTEQNKLASVEAVMMPSSMKMDQQFQLLQSYANRVSNTGVPVINAWVRGGKRAISGDPMVTGFDTALRTVIDEYPKLVSTITGSGQVADAERQRWDKILGDASTPEQIQEAIKVMGQDKGFQMQSYQNMREILNQRVKALRGAPIQGAGAPNNKASVFITNPKTGERMQLNPATSQWEKVQ